MGHTCACTLSLAALSLIPVLSLGAHMRLQSYPLPYTRAYTQARTEPQRQAEREIDEGGEEEEGVMCEGGGGARQVHRGGACQVHPSASASGAGALDGGGYVSRPSPPSAITGATSSPHLHPKVYIYIHTYIRARAHTHTHTHIHIYTYICIYIICICIRISGGDGQLGQLEQRQ